MRVNKAIDKMVCNTPFPATWRKNINLMEQPPCPPE